MVANYAGGDKEVEIEIKNFSVSSAKMNCIDKDRSYDELPLTPNSNLTIKLPEHAVYLLTFEK